MKQRVLVTGGAGLIGSHLVDRLLARGDEVIVVDDLSIGSFANLAHLKHEPRFALVEHDVSKPFTAKIYALFHLAVPSTRSGCELDPVHATMTCVAGTNHAMEVAAENGARVVVATATERFGEGVRCAESLAVSYAQAHGIDVRVVRVPETYGPRMMPDTGFVVSALALAAIRGDELVPPPEDGALRLAYVDDVVETLLRTMDSDLHTPAVVAPSTSTTVSEVARLIAATAGAFEPVSVQPSIEDAPYSAFPVSRRSMLPEPLPASLALGQSPTVDLATGLARTVAWFESRLAQHSDLRTSGIFAKRPEAQTG